MSIAWVSARESLPDADLVVMVALKDCDEPVWMGYYDGERWLDIEGMAMQTVTHWMSLPEPPK